MAHYQAMGSIPPKRHTQHRRPAGRGKLGELYYEELMGEEGFSSDSSLLYHRNIPSTIVDDAERTAAYEKLNQQIQEEYLPALAISHSPPALVVGEGVEGVVASPLTAEEFSGVTVGGK